MAEVVELNIVLAVLAIVAAMGSTMTGVLSLLLGLLAVTLVLFHFDRKRAG
ncbi:hypothetical protein [Bradyrhizobium jicamae]|uniref:hypothetical protein n=1 Tax=Bradyrhizobium jicamae TaxID=280332 RepID=UPI00289A859C|nr:hypothetical protein [Bradyrhizobium jicamae]